MSGEPHACCPSQRRFEGLNLMIHSYDPWRDRVTDETTSLPDWAAKLPPFPPKPRRRFLLLDDSPTEPMGPHPEEIALAKVEQSIDYGFHERRLLRCALTSPGWRNENRMTLDGCWADNKALEWLGDSVLYMVVTEGLVDSGDASCTGKSTPSRAKVIANERLAEIGERLELWDALYLGRGERRNNQGTGRQRYLACAVEAILGAIWLDVRAQGEQPMAVVRGVVDGWTLAT
jgi:hypothetical protein